MKSAASLPAASTRRLRLVGAAATLLLGATLAGCVISTNDSTHITGKQVTEDKLAQVKPGAAKDAVIDLLGLPSNRMDLGSGLEVWEWKSTQTQKKSSDIIFVFSSDKSTSVENTTSVEFKDGVVTRTWTK
jgi:outer membrane protein assembly factor BamE (lipoprotein component of BamABCDE complex)